MSYETAQHPLGPWIGARYDVPIEEVPQQYMAELYNAEIMRNGGLRSRLGYDEYIDSAIVGVPPCLGLGEHEFNASTSRKWCIQGSVFYEDVSGTWTDRTGAVSITNDQDNLYFSTNAAGTLILSSLSDGPFKWAAAGGNLAALGVSSRFTSNEISYFWDNRVWHAHTDADEDAVWYTDQNAIETVGATSVLYADNIVRAVSKGFVEDGEFGSGVMLCVHTREGIWVPVPTNVAATPYAWRLKTPIGANGKMNVAELPDGGQIFLNEENLYYWRGGGEPQVIEATDGERFWDNLNTSRLKYANNCVDTIERRVWFNIPWGSAQGSNNRVAQIDYRTKELVGIHADFSRNASAFFDGLPHMGGVDDGLIWKHNSGNTDDDASITIRGTFSGAPPINSGVDVLWTLATMNFEPQAVDVSVLFSQSGSGLASVTESVDFGDPSDALVTEFTIGTSVIRGGSAVQPIDIDLTGWSRQMTLRLQAENVVV